jgi:hypothetical protein
LTLGPALVTATHPFGMYKFAALLLLAFAAVFLVMVLIGNHRDKRKARKRPSESIRD